MLIHKLAYTYGYCEWLTVISMMVPNQDAIKILKKITKNNAYNWYQSCCNT